jgi:hypothetical protein
MLRLCLFGEAVSQDLNPGTAPPKRRGIPKTGPASSVAPVAIRAAPYPTAKCHVTQTSEPRDAEGSVLYPRPLVLPSHREPLADGRDRGGPGLEGTSDRRCVNNRGEGRRRPRERPPASQMNRDIVQLQRQYDELEATWCTRTGRIPGRRRPIHVHCIH